MKSVIEKRPASPGEFRVWSAASSSGEEAYSIAMVLGNHYGTRGWKIVGTDLSTAMVDTARRAVYPMERARQTALADLKRWCLKGQGDNAGKLNDLAGAAPERHLRERQPDAPAAGDRPTRL